MALAVLQAPPPHWLDVRGVSTPIAAMTVSMRRLADNDLTAEITGTGRGDEIGAMAGAVAVFKSGMLEAARLESENRRPCRAKSCRAAKSG